MSMKLTPAQATRTSTWPRPGEGMSISTRWRTSGPPYCSMRMARMMLLLPQGDRRPVASVDRHADPAFHQPAGRSAHDHLSDDPKTILAGRLRADAESSGRVAESHAPLRGKRGNAVDDRTGNGRGGDGHGARPCHRMVQLPHGEDPRQEIDGRRIDVPAVGAGVSGRLCNEGNLGRVGPLGSG